MTVKTIIALARQLLASPGLLRHESSNTAVRSAIGSVLAQLETAARGNQDVLALVAQVRGALER